LCTLIACRGEQSPGHGHDAIDGPTNPSGPAVDGWDAMLASRLSRQKDADSCVAAGTPSQKSGPRTKISSAWLESPGTTWSDEDWNATKRPSSLMLPRWEAALTWVPRAERDSRLVVPATMSRTKMSDRPLTSCGTRSSLNDSNTTNRPSPLM